MSKIGIRTVEVIRYLQPLREGGSLPAIVKADDDFLYVIKFRGAGQGKKALVAEFIGGELARAVGLKVPELVFMNLDKSFSKTEPDEEIQDLLKFSVGLNLGLHFLSGSITYDPLSFAVDPMEASKVVLLDSMIVNIDRTSKNTNLLDWKGELWLIDHGASLYFHHNWSSWRNHLNRFFDRISDHVLIDRATQLDKAAAEIGQLLTSDKIEEIVSLIPEDWLTEDRDEISASEKRKRYIEFLTNRFSNLESIAKQLSDVQ